MDGSILVLSDSSLMHPGPWVTEQFLVMTGAMGNGLTIGKGST